MSEAARQQARTDTRAAAEARLTLPSRTFFTAAAAFLAPPLGGVCFFSDLGSAAAQGGCSSSVAHRLGRRQRAAGGNRSARDLHAPPCGDPSLSHCSPASQCACRQPEGCSPCLTACLRSAKGCSSSLLSS